MAVQGAGAALALALAGCAAVEVHGGPAFDTGGAALPGTGWVAVPLPLVPGGMNDAGIVSGQVGGLPAAYAGGTLSLLGTLSWASCGAYLDPVIPATAYSIASSCDNKFGVFWFLWNHPPGVVSQTTPIPAGVEVHGLNMAIEVVGTAFFPPADRRAFRFQPGGNLELIHPEFLVLGPSRVVKPDASVANGVNDAGFVAGTAFAGDTSFPVLWPPGSATPRVLPASAQPAEATVVRAAVVAGSSGPNAVTWTLAGVPALSQPVLGLTRVTAMSAPGRLAGSAVFTDAQGARRSRAWTWLPGAAQPTFLPAPGEAAGDSFLPVGIDTCGNIAAKVLDGSGRAKGGVLLTRSSVRAVCDTPPVAVQ